MQVPCIKLNTVNAVTFQKLAHVLHIKTKYEIQSFEDDLFGHKEKIIEKAVIEIAASLDQMVKTDAKRLELQMDNSYFLKK